MLIRDAPSSGFVHQIMNLFEKINFSNKKSLLVGSICEEGSAVSLASLSGVLGEKYTAWVTVPNARKRESLRNELSDWGMRVYCLQDSDHHFSGEFSQTEILQKLVNGESGILLLPRDWYTIECVAKDSLIRNQNNLSVGDTLDLDQLKEELVDAGYERVSTVFRQGQFAIRGGILDIFSLTTSIPIRIELFDVEIESIREFDLDTQISSRQLKVWKNQLSPSEENGLLSDYLREGDVIVGFEEDALLEADLAPQIILSSSPIGFDVELEIQGSPFPALNPGDFVMQEASNTLVREQLRSWAEDGWEIILSSSQKGERDRFFEIIGEVWRKHKQVKVSDLHLMHTLILPSAKMAMVSLSEIFGRFQVKPRVTAQADFWQNASSRHAKTEELVSGELVVHAEYGVGQLLEVSDPEGDEESIQIEYHNGAVLEVPIGQSHLVAKYVGVGTVKPKLSKLGDARWAKLKEKAQSSVMDYAARMLRVQAERSAEEGTPHPPDTKWMWEFESSFQYQETPDQLTAIQDAKMDMESPFAMDRLVCGDVGFGKTEVAIRAAFKAVCGGYQVVMLAPTTVLAEQHHRTFCERMSMYPIQIDLLNRFRKPSEVRDTLEGLRDGSVDIVIGTHKVLSEAVTYKNLGLVVIDEEQRFGVMHKEKFKERFSQVDMLTLSATPIPRTLYLSLMGARDMSVLNTAPANRNPVQTQVLEYDEGIIQRAVERELNRGGQTFILHNRVKTIHHLAKRVRELVPHARIVVGHGQMERHELEDVMHTFVEGKADVLIATTIIESGIDIPNANTILIDRADLFGLSDLYQLRGRVGRANLQAYAYLLLPKKELFTGDAKKRVSAIKQFTALGSGFKIAMRDLEIRGAGNLLGTKQSGHIAAVGFDLYCQLLKESVAKLKGERSGVRADVTLRLDFVTFAESRYSQESKTSPAFIPVSYLSNGKERLVAHRRLSLSESIKGISEIEAEWRDRYGRLPQSAKNLLMVTRIKLYGALAEVDSIEVKGERVMISRKGGFITLAKGAFPRLEKKKPNAKLTELEGLMKDLVAGF